MENAMKEEINIVENEEVQTQKTEVEVDENMFFKKLKIKSKIFQYLETFPDELRGYRDVLQYIDTYDLEKLESVKKEIAIVASTRSSTGMYKNLYYGSCQFVEKFSTHLGYSLDGFTSLVKENKEIDKCLNEIILQFDTDTYIEPQYRLILYTFQMAMATHKAKNVKNVYEKILTKKIKPDIKKKYKDL